MTGEPTQTASKVLCTPVYQSSSEKKVAITLLYQLCSTHYQPVQIEKQPCNQSSQYEKSGKFSVTERKPLCTTTKSTLFTVTKDE